MAEPGEGRGGDRSRLKMEMERCETLEARSVATRREEIDCETVRRRRRCDREKDAVGVSWLSEIPLPLLNDILIRIPVDTVFSCRCVCKTFFNMLTDPQFAQDHFTRAANTGGEEALLIQDNDNIRDIFLVYNYTSVLEKTDHADSHLQTLSPPTSAPPHPAGGELVGSCNGFLCIYYEGFDLLYTYYVCNPILGEFLAIPHHDMANYHVPAFGFCPKTNQYKVILFFSSLCKIHTLGTDCWREISENVPNDYYSGSYHQSFRGFVHWIVTPVTVSKMICSFNLETEQASFLPTPSHLTHDTVPKLSCFQIGTLGGSFCLSYHRDTTLEVCVMKNYGVKESWSKVFSIELNPGFREWFFACRYAFINGDFFFEHKLSSIVCYNLQKGTIKKLLADDVPDTQVKPFSPSLISLKDIVVDFGGNVEVVDRKMRRNNCCDKGFEFIR